MAVSSDNDCVSVHYIVAEATARAVAVNMDVVDIIAIGIVVANHPTTWAKVHNYKGRNKSVLRAGKMSVWVGHPVRPPPGWIRPKSMWVLAPTPSQGVGLPPLKNGLLAPADP